MVILNQILLLRLFKILDGTKLSNGPATNRELPSHLDINLLSFSAPPPTHVLALQGQKGNSRITYQPVYALVIAVYCASISPLLFSERSPSITSVEKVKVPVIRLDIPYPQLFGLLHFYLYTKDRSALLRTLLSCHREQVSLLLDRARRSGAVSLLKSIHDAQSLLLCAQKVCKFWKNINFLEVCDSSLWTLIDHIWDLISDALRTTR